MSGTRAISTTSRRELSPRSVFFLQGKALKEIHAILTETIACFLPGRVKDLSEPPVQALFLITFNKMYAVETCEKLWASVTFQPTLMKMCLCYDNKTVRK